MLLPGPVSKPIALVALAWGSRSMSNMRLPFSAKQAERFTAVVVLPTPPFWLAIAKSFIRTASLIPGRAQATQKLTGVRGVQEFTESWSLSFQARTDKSKSKTGIQYPDGALA